MKSVKMFFVIILLQIIPFQVNAQIWKDSTWIAETYYAVLIGGDEEWSVLSAYCGDGGGPVQRWSATHLLVCNKSYKLLYQALESKNVYAKLYAAIALVELDKKEIISIDVDVKRKIEILFSSKKIVETCEGCHGDILPINEILYEDFDGFGESKVLDDVFAWSTNRPYLFKKERKLKKYIKENLVYPKGFDKSKHSGEIIIEFIVEPTGEITNIKFPNYYNNMKILDTVGIPFQCKEEALRLIREMPYWTPAEIADRKIRCQYSLNIPFGKIKKEK